MSGFADYIKHPSVESLAEDAKSIYTWDSSVGAQVQAAAIVIAMRDLEKTAVRLDEAAGNLQRWALGLAWVSLAVSVAALVVAIVS